MDVQLDQAKSTEGWKLLSGGQIIRSNCDPSNNYSVPYIYGTRDEYKPWSGIYNCVSNVNQLPYVFEITREVITSLPHYLINFEIELIIFGNWAIEGINSCTRSDYVVLTADQKQYKYTLLEAITDQNACKNPNNGYLIRITNSIEHKASSLIISLQTNTLSDFTMVSFGIRKFDISSNLCPDEKCLTCNDQYTCLSCSDNYLVSFDGRQCVQSCPQNYLIQAGKCVRTCGPDSILDVPTKTCILCDPNCEICSKINYCQKCYLQYYQFRGQCYSQCPVDSVQPTDGTNQCKECSQGCLECNSQGLCRQCESKYVLWNGKCEKCYDQNCSVCQNGGQYGCQYCEKGFYFSEKKCISDKCQDDSYRVMNKECQVCMGGFYYDLTSHTCIECHSLCHGCLGTSWDQCNDCSTQKWKFGDRNITDLDVYPSKLGICECKSSNEFDTVSDTCAAIGHWDVMSDIMLFLIFFASLQLAYRGKMIFLMNFMYFVQSLALLGFLNLSYPYFLQNMLNAFNRVNLPSLFPRVLIIDSDKMTINDRSQTVYFTNSSAGIEDVFSNSKFMLYYDRTSNFMLNIPNFLIINTIPFLAFIFLFAYEKTQKKKYRYDRRIRNELIPFFLYHSLVDVFFYIIMQFEHATTRSSINVVGTIGAVIALIILIVIAYIHTYKLLRSVIAFRKKEKDHNILTFSIYLRDINFLNGNIFQQNFRTIQVVKQFILVCSIVGAYGNQVTQAILVLVFQFIYYMILIIVRPFAQDQHNKEHIIYETLLFFNIFLGCWYQLSFGIEGQGIMQFVGVVFIISIFILLASLMTSTLYNFYKIEKPIFKQYMEKRHLINQERNRQKLMLQKKKNSITELAKNDVDLSSDMKIDNSDSDSEKSGSQNQQNKSNPANLANQSTNHKKIIQTPKNVLPNGLKSSKNVSSTNNKNASSFFNNNEDTLNIQLGPDYRDINKTDFPPYNNQILAHDMPNISELYGGQSRRNPYAQNNHSMSYYLNETDQNIITETYIKQQANDNPNILSVLDDEINQNLENLSVVRLSERHENNGQLYQIPSQQNYNLVNNNLDKQDKYNPQNKYSQQFQSSSVNFAEKPIVSQSIASNFYDKKANNSQNQKSLQPNEIPMITQINTDLQDAKFSVLQPDSSIQSFIVQRNEGQQPNKCDDQSFGVADNRSVAINNEEEDDYNRTFVISQNAIQQVTNYHLSNENDSKKQDPLKNFISRSQAISNFPEQPPRAKTGAHNRNLVQDNSMSDISSAYPRTKTENSQFPPQKDDDSTNIDFQKLRDNKQLEHSITIGQNNYISHASLNNINSQDILTESILNQTIEPIIRGNQKQSSLLNTSGIKQNMTTNQKAIFQQTGRQLANSQSLSQTNQEIVKPFRESPTKPQKFATKKKKSMQNSKIVQNKNQKQKEDMPPPADVSGIEYLHNQTNQFIKKALDTELMYKWKDQQYNYDEEDGDDQ